MSPSDPARPSLNGWNAAYLDAMHEQWRTDPDSVDPAWRSFFQGFDLGLAQADSGAPALPDAEANVIRNLMERIDELEGTVTNLQRCLREVAEGRQLRNICRGESQSLKDREILEFLGESEQQT